MANLEEIARRRCERLLELAAEAHSKEPELAERYVKLARKVAQRHRLSLGSRRFCRKCSTIWIPGRTVKVRLARAGKTAFYICANCKSVRRFPYSLKGGGGPKA